MTQIAGCLAVFLMMAFGAVPVSAQATIVARAFDAESGEAIKALVSVFGEDDTRRETDSLGVATFRSVRAGSHAFRAQAIGYQYDLAFVDVEDGDSLDIAFRLSEAHVGFSGVTAPYPQSDMVPEATSLLQSDARIVAAVDAVAGAVSGPVTVWLPWAPGFQDTLVIENRFFVFKGDCAACVKEVRFTIEGNRYRTGKPHFLLGVTSGSATTPMLHFCIIRGSSFTEFNCPDGHRGDLTFARWPDGTWKKVPAY